jgi:hypothetical protein
MTDILPYYSNKMIGGELICLVLDHGVGVSVFGVLSGAPSGEVYGGNDLLI